MKFVSCELASRSLKWAPILTVITFVLPTYSYVLVPCPLVYPIDSVDQDFTFAHETGLTVAPKHQFLYRAHDELTQWPIIILLRRVHYIAGGAARDMRTSQQRNADAKSYGES